MRTLEKILWSQEESWEILLHAGQQLRIDDHELNFGLRNQKLVDGPRST